MDEMTKPMGEWSVEDLFEEMDSLIDLLDKKGIFSSQIYTFLKEIVLRAGPPYEVYKQFNLLQDTLEKMENYNMSEPEFIELSGRAKEIWKEIKAWCFD
jgi:hypothetical protein